MNFIFKSISQTANFGYKLMQIQSPSRSSIRYKSVGIQKKIRMKQDRYKFDSPNSLLLQELQEESDYMIPLTPEHIKDQVEFRKLEMKKLQNQIRTKSIEYKYFRPYRREVQREPNFLTWAMKEQLINLHTHDPETWTVETLSHVFPASQFRVKQILNTKMNPPSEEKRKKHDESVLRNWKTFTNGKFGSIRLLEKIISKGIESAGGEKLPAELGSVSQRTKGLIFTPVGDIHGEEELLSTPVETKKHFWFRDIITKYEDRKLQASSDNTTSTAITTNTSNNEKIELQNYKNLEEIRSIRNRNYDHQSPMVQVSYETKPHKQSKRQRSITFEQFMNRKNKRRDS